MLQAIKNWFGGKRSAQASRLSARSERRPQLAVEALEEREVPSAASLYTTVLWGGAIPYSTVVVGDITSLAASGSHTLWRAVMR
jgi:hypothetical protein